MTDSQDIRSGGDESDWRPQREHSRISIRLVDASAPRSGNLLWWLVARRLKWLMNDYVIVVSVGLLFAGLATSEPLLFRSAVLLSLLMTIGCFLISATLPWHLRRLGLAEELFASLVEVRHFEEALGSVLTLCRMHWALLVVATFVGAVIASVTRAVTGAGVNSVAFASAALLFLFICAPFCLLILRFLDIVFWSNVRWGIPVLVFIAAGTYGIRTLIEYGHLSMIGLLGFVLFWTILLFPTATDQDAWKKYRLVETLKKRSGVG